MRKIEMTLTPAAFDRMMDDQGNKPGFCMYTQDSEGRQVLEFHAEVKVTRGNPRPVEVVAELPKLNPAMFPRPDGTRHKPHRPWPLWLMRRFRERK